jgi:hypothetical protein
MIWERNGDMFHATTRDPSGEVLFHLVVERLNHAWDWSVWRPDEPADMANLGVAATPQEAIQAAERAAR